MHLPCFPGFSDRFFLSEPVFRDRLSLGSIRRTRA